MRINPLHENTCKNRIAMYRKGQCTDGPKVCIFLTECEYTYDEVTGLFDCEVDDLTESGRGIVKPRTYKWGRSHGKKRK